jgi:TonB family protein
MVSYLLNSLWQIPLVFAAAWIAARLARRAGPSMAHRIWVSALLLEVLLPLCRFRLNDVWRQAWALILYWRGSGAAEGGHIRVTMGAGMAAGMSVLRVPALVAAAILAAYLLSVAYFAFRTVWGLRRTAAILRLAGPLRLDGELHAKFERCCRLLHIPSEAVRIASSSAVAGPASLGVMQRMLLLPAGFLKTAAADDVEAVFAHELAHAQRRDFAKNLLYELLSLPAAYHPVLRLTRARLAETREMICDLTAADAVAGRDGYARSLLRLASMLSARTPAKPLHAIGILDANILERRIMSLTEKTVKARLGKRIAIVAACGAMAFATCFSAVALRVNVDGPAAQTAPPKNIHVREANLKVVDRKAPVYPAEAKANHDTLDGSVVLALTIGKDGAVENINVKKSLRGDYDQSAMEAVRQWKYEPYLLNGDPIEVKTDVTITYSLAE